MSAARLAPEEVQARVLDVVRRDFDGGFKGTVEQLARKANVRVSELRELDEWLDEQLDAELGSDESESPSESARLLADVLEAEAESLATGVWSPEQRRRKSGLRLAIRDQVALASAVGLGEEPSEAALVVGGELHRLVEHETAVAAVGELWSIYSRVNALLVSGDPDDVLRDSADEIREAVRVLSAMIGAQLGGWVGFVNGALEEDDE